MTVTSEFSAEEHMTQRNALALIITNAYRTRHGMTPLDTHATVDEDIAEAIIRAGWQAPDASTESSSGKPKGSEKISFLSESISHGVGSTTSARAQHIRRIATEVMDEHCDWTDRNDEHTMRCVVDSATWPCPEYETARAAFIHAGGKSRDF